MVTLTAFNVQRILGVYPERLPDVLPKVFEQLQDENLEEMALHNYVVAIKDRFANDSRPMGHMGFDSFGEAAFESGIVPAMLKVTQDPRTDPGHGLASYSALDSMIHLMRTGTADERRALLKELLANDVVEICISKIDHPLAIHRQLATNTIRNLASESFLGEYLTSKQTSDIMVKMCEFLLEGPDFYVKQMKHRETTWQSCLCFGNHDTSPTKAAQYAPRYYAMAQENAAWAIHGLLCRAPPPSMQYRYEILTRNPELLPLLFQCALVARHPWYPESQVDGIICEVITLLFYVSPHSVPGVIDAVDGVVKEMADEDRKVMIDIFKLLTARPQWPEMLIAIWNNIDDERWQDLKTMSRDRVRLHHAQMPLGNEEFLAIFEYRGGCRICVERLIATLTHIADECQVSDADLVFLLRIGNAASQPVKTMQQIFSDTDSYVWVERSFQIFRSPMYTVYTEDKVDPPLQIVEEPMMGPTAFVRLLTMLATRDLLEKIPKWKKLPAGISGTTTLAQVKQMTGPERIRTLLPLALRRVTGHRELGHKRIKRDNEMDFAGFAYSCAAELAAALVAFDEATDGKYRDLLHGARKELVLCLGNAAEMAIGIKHFKRALSFATGAVEAAKNLPARDQVEETVIAKNLRRVDRARAGLGQLVPTSR